MNLKDLSDEELVETYPQLLDDEIFHPAVED
jgi:hypothetical protein